MKTFIPLENNPEVMNQLATSLGLSPAVAAFHDVYSLDEPSLLALIPRPAYALLVTIPMTAPWKQLRQKEADEMSEYRGSGLDEPVVWFKQTIIEACGSIGLIHCAVNGPAVAAITPGSELERLLNEAIPLKMADRAKLLERSDVLESAHLAAAFKGDTQAPNTDAAAKLGNHFIAFVKGKDGHLWELEGSRKGPLDRGLLNDDEDVLSEKALELGIKRYVKLDEEASGRELRFSCIALAPKLV